MGELDFGRLKSEIHVLFCDGICMRVKEGFELVDRKQKSGKMKGGATTLLVLCGCGGDFKEW